MLFFVLKQHNNKLNYIWDGDNPGTTQKKLCFDIPIWWSSTLFGIVVAEFEKYPVTRPIVLCRNRSNPMLARKNILYGRSNCLNIL